MTDILSFTIFVGFCLKFHEKSIRLEEQSTYLPTYSLNCQIGISKYWQPLTKSGSLWYTLQKTELCFSFFVASFTTTHWGWIQFEVEFNFFSTSSISRDFFHFLFNECNSRFCSLQKSFLNRDSTVLQKIGNYNFDIKLTLTPWWIMNL